MHCRTCGYALWNLSEPRCPECGSGFRLHDFRFQPGTVGFACPHCGHLHGGTGDQHLPAESSQALCLGCGQTMTVAAMRVVPLVDDLRKAEAVSADRLPWEDRAAIGRWKAWWRTMTMTLGSPTRVAERIDPNARWSDAYWFACRTYAFGFLIQASCFALLMTLLGIGVMINGYPHGGVLIYMAAVLPVMATLGALIMPLVITAFVAAPAHLFLKITGEKKAGFSLTAVSALYAQSPFSFYAIPICGHYLNPAWQIWSLVLAILITMKTQQVSGLRATFAYLWFTGITIVLFIALIITAEVMAP